MSLRTLEQDLSDRLAKVEEKQRALEARARITPNDVRLLYGARGEILWAEEPSKPVALAPPTTTPAGYEGRWVLAFRQSSLSVEWAFLATGDETQFVT